MAVTPTESILAQSENNSPPAFGTFSIQCEYFRPLAALEVIFDQHIDEKIVDSVNFETNRTLLVSVRASEGSNDLTNKPGTFSTSC